MKIYTILCILLGYFALQMSYHRIKNITSTLGDSLYAISAEPAIQERDLRAHITKLAGEIGPRNIEDEAHYQKLDAAATYIEETMQMFGYKPNIYTYDATYKGNQFSLKNIEAVVEGSHPSNGYIVIGAHYDTVAGSPGADDNGSGVAALLEIARHLHSLDKQKIKTTIKLVTFPNEEAPYSLDPKTQKSFSTNMGSVVYAKQAKAKNDTIIGMICLESIGYYSDTPGSQRYPCVLKWLQWFYGNKGNFLMALSDRASKNFLNRFIRVYNQDAHSFPMHANALPNIKLTRDIGRSDHKSFWIEGYPALMLTDTANFRNGHYHEGTDMPDSVNYEALTKVTNQLCLAVERLACE